MKYNIGEEVLYKGHKCYIDRGEERTTLITACGKKPEVKMFIRYDLYDSIKDEYICSVGETEISPYDDSFEWKEDVVYNLNCGYTAIADMENECLVLDDCGITIPFKLYDDGICEIDDYTVISEEEE